MANQNADELLHRLRNTTHAVLQYDYERDDLVVWFWPTNGRGERVTPSDLGAHRLSHAMLGPCCLCPLSQQRPNNFQEAIIYLVRRGRFAGEYVAACTKSECGYFVLMERVHSRPGIPLRFYPIRDADDPAPRPPVCAWDEDGFMNPQVRAEDIDLAMIQTYQPVTYNTKAIFHLLMQLDSIFNAGLSIEELKKLLAKCRQCGRVMTRRVIQWHTCDRKVMEVDIIDLTGEED